MCTKVRAREHARLHTSDVSVGEMSKRREVVYLVATDFDGSELPSPLHLYPLTSPLWRTMGELSAPACKQIHVHTPLLTVMCVVRDWHGTLGDASAQPDVHGMWHPAEPSWAVAVTGMWRHRAAPKWLFRLHYPAKTLDMPSTLTTPQFIPHSFPSWSQKPFNDH